MKEKAGLILNQTIKPDEIIVWYSNEGYFLDKGIPDSDIPNIPGITFKKTKNIGSLRKLLPLLEDKRLGKNVKIIMMDDDITYPSNAIETLVRYSENYPDSAIGVMGKGIIPDKELGWTVKNTLAQKVSPMDFVMNGLCLVKPRFFTEDLFNWKKEFPLSYKLDDFWVSGNLMRNGVPRKIVPFKAYSDYIIRQEIDKQSIWWNYKEIKQNNGIDIQRQIVEHFKPYWEGDIDVFDKNN